MSTPSSVAVPLGLRSSLVLGVASVAGLMMLCWPLLVDVPPEQHLQPPFFFLALLPLVVLVVIAEVSEGGMDSRVLALLGVLSAANALIRMLGAGTAGIELVFFLLILAGRVFGPGFGFVLGCTSLFASALLTAGVGPWLAVPDGRRRLGRDGCGAAPAPGPRPGGDRDPGRVRRGRGVLLRDPDEPLGLAVRARHRRTRLRGRPVVRPRRRAGR